MSKMLFDVEPLRIVESERPHTIDLIFLIFPRPERYALDPIPWQDVPSNDAERVPSEVNQRRFRIPKAFPPL